MFKLGLLVFGTGIVLGLRSLLARRASSTDEAGDNFASEQENAWATTGWRIAGGLVVLGAALMVVGLAM